jgi:hypothetical protein
VRIPEVRDWPASARIAGVFLLAALALDVAVLVRLRTVRDEAAVAPLVIRAVPRIVIHTPDDAELVHAAANSAPFGGEPSAGAPMLATPVLLESAPTPAPVRPRLVGTVVQGNGGGFVIVEMPDARMQLVRVGEQAGELRLRSVSAGEAVFDDPRGRRVSLRTPAPGAELRP